MMSFCPNDFGQGAEAMYDIRTFHFFASRLSEISTGLVEYSTKMLQGL